MLLEPLTDVPALDVDDVDDFTALVAVLALVVFVLVAVWTTVTFWLVSTVLAAATTMVLRVVRALERTLAGVCGRSSSTDGLQHRSSLLLNTIQQ